MARSATEHDHGGVQLGAEGQVVGPAALGQEDRRHLRARAGCERGGGVATTVMATGCVGSRRQAQFAHLRPAVHQIQQCCKAGVTRGAGRGRRRRRGCAGGPAGGGHDLPTPPRLLQSQVERGGFASLQFGRGSACLAIRASQADLAARVRISPFHWAGSREPSRLNPGHEPHWLI